jgi:MFS family permease
MTTAAKDRNGLTIALGSAAVFFIALELTIISVAMPEIADAFPDSSRATLSWIFTAYNVGVAAFLLIGGWMAERFGRRRLFMIGLVVFTVGSLASGLAPSVALLIAARTVQAVGGALLIPASLAVVLHAVPQERHDVAIGIWGAMAGLAAAVGPTVGAVLVNAVGWRSVFLVNVPLAVAVGVIAVIVVVLLQGCFRPRRRHRYSPHRGEQRPEHRAGC